MGDGKGDLRTGERDRITVPPPTGTSVTPPRVVDVPAGRIRPSVEATKWRVTEVLMEASRHFGEDLGPRLHQGAMGAPAHGQPTRGASVHVIRRSFLGVRARKLLACKV